MKKVFLLSVIAMLILASCKKEETTESDINNTEVSKNYMPLKIGNYWVYEQYHVDTAGNQTSSATTDSLIVDRDTTINGETFFILMGNFMSPTTWRIVSILRDSSNYIIDNHSNILFSENNFVDTLAEQIYITNSDTLFTLFYKMEQSDAISTPAGLFEDILNFRGIINVKNPINGVENPRYNCNYYANNIGRVLIISHYVNSTTKLERRLIRYNIKTQ